MPNVNPRILLLLSGVAAASLVGCGDDPSRWNDVRGVWSIEAYVRTAPNTECGNATEDASDQIDQGFLVTEALVGGVNTDLWVRSCVDLDDCASIAETLRGGRPPESGSSYSTVARHLDPVADATLELDGCSVTRPNNLVFVERDGATLTVTERSVPDFELDASSGCTEAAARAALRDACEYESRLTSRRAASLPSL